LSLSVTEYISKRCISLSGGAAATLAKGRGALQDIEQIFLMDTVCKNLYSIRSIREIIPTMREACKAAVSGTPGKEIKSRFVEVQVNRRGNALESFYFIFVGPVFVEIPIDMLYPYKVTEKESVIQPKNILQWIVSKLVCLFLCITCINYYHEYP
jgi:acetolactate synthase-like protein